MDFLSQFQSASLGRRLTAVGAIVGALMILFITYVSPPPGLNSGGVPASNSVQSSAEAQSSVAVSETPQERARNNQRQNDVTRLLNALHQYVQTNGGAFAYTGEIDFKNFPTESTEICRHGSLEECGLLVYLGPLVPTYLSKLPMDPNGPEGDSIGYAVRQDAGKWTVSAPKAEGGKTIEMTR